MKTPILFALLAALAPALRAAEAAPLSLSPSGMASVHGKVIELGSSDGLPEALIDVVGDTDNSVSGDDQGLFRIQVQAGEIQLRVRVAGHAPALKKIKLAPGQDLKLNVYATRVDFQSDEFVVTASKERPQVVTTTLSREEIKKIPGTGGDALRAIQNLPGVASVSDYSSQMVVQGGGPNDNLYLIDNIPWPFPFHFGGIISTVNSDLLQSVDLYSAGFGVRWGNIMGAILDGKTRPGKKDRLHVSADISLIMTQLMIEGPLGLGDASFTLAGRRSYFDFLLKRLSSASNFTALPVFWDLGGSLDFSLGPDNQFRLLALANDDLLGLSIKPDAGIDPELVGEFHLDNNAVTSGLRWTNTSLRSLRSIFTPYYYKVGIETSIGTGANISNHQDVAGVKEELEWDAGSLAGMSHEIGLGGSLQSVHASTLIYIYRNFFAAPGAPQGPVSTTVTADLINRAAYVQDRIELGRALAFTAGLHYDKNDLVAGDISTPRLSLEYKPDPQTSLKAAWGLYDQFPGGMQTNRDFGNPGLSANLAEHTVLSAERQFGEGRSIRLDGYYKSYRDLVSSVPTSERYDNGGEGHARGLELFIRQAAGDRFFGWLSYAYSQSERMDGQTKVWSLYQYDQTHLATLVANYKITAPWSLGAKLHYNTGPLQQSYKGRYQDAQGHWYGVFSDTYDFRLDDYLRLDLRTDYTLRNQGWSVSVYAEVLNLLDRANPQDLNYPRDYSTAPETVNNLPRFPYFGISVEF